MGRRRHVLTEVRQDFNPGLPTALQYDRQLVLPFEFKDKSSFEFIDETQEKAFFICVICVAKGWCRIPRFSADLSPSATKLRDCAQNSQIKICAMSRCIAWSLLFHVKLIRLAATKVLAMAFDEALRPAHSDLYFRYLSSGIMGHSQGDLNGT